MARRTGPLTVEERGPTFDKRPDAEGPYLLFLVRPDGIQSYYAVLDALRGYHVDYGYVPMDNGIVERLHVRTALTRKNYLFAGSDGGAERAAIAYTILGSCRLVGIDPLEYLRDVLPRMTRKVRLVDLSDLLPHRWKQRRDAVAALCAAVARLGRGD